MDQLVRHLTVNVGDVSSNPLLSHVDQHAFLCFGKNLSSNRSYVKASSKLKIDLK